MTFESTKALVRPVPANDNAPVRGEPTVRVARGRSRAIYARSGDVLLPMRFAARMPGWRST
ncbi:MAG TPA: hypothetical protein VHJ20_03320 [Polyangia bacterium]|nr:hypothetical protein [Polyangia bacterium]